MSGADLVDPIIYKPLAVYQAVSKVKAILLAQPHPSKNYDY